MSDLLALGPSAGSGRSAYRILRPMNVEEGRTQWTWLVLVGLYLAFFSWYTSFGGPLTDEEIAHCIAQLESSDPIPSGVQIPLSPPGGRVARRSPRRRRQLSASGNERAPFRTRARAFCTCVSPLLA